jgi:hypothetical protein
VLFYAYVCAQIRLCTCISHLPRVSSQQGYQGEATELGGRLCVAVPASPDGMPKGILLGSGPGGSVW